MKENTIIILTTGGTIAGVGAPGVDTGYVSGAIKGENLIASVPGLTKIDGVGDIVTYEVCNVNSDDINDSAWISILAKIDELSDDNNVKGFVITHGTDTMEETAFFLSFTVKTDKPVIITGAMHPSTSTAPDGPKNLTEAVSAAAGFNSHIVSKRHNNVYVSFAGKLIDGLKVTKISTTKLNAFEKEKWSENTMEFIRDKYEDIYPKLSRIYNNFSEDKLPRVNVVYFCANADASILKHAASISDGIVVAGAGSGEFSKDYIKVIESLDVPVAVCSRISEGCVTKENLLCKNTTGYYELSPQKAAILLKLLLL